MRRQFIKTLYTSIATAVVLTSLSGPAMARSWVDTATTENRITTRVTKDDSIIMRSDQSFKQVRVANADIADVLVLTNRSFQVIGKSSGKTNVMLYDATNQLIDVVDVTVGFDVKGLKQSLFETFPNEKVEVRHMAGGVYISGRVASGDVADRVMQIAQAYAPERVTNGLSVRDSHQVMLEVRFIEATRDVIKDLGIGILSQSGNFSAATAGGLVSGLSPALSALGVANIGNASIDVTLDALEENGVVRTLAEPNLVAMSGDTASFLAGGEFPIPVQADEDTITIEYRQFGVGLSFTPTVLDDGIINLQVAPEVSQLDQANAVTVGGVSVPALSVRRADTTVELRNSQSFAVAGLLQNNSTNVKTQVPWLGDVPILGALFRSSSYQKNETELVIIVTPRLVQPVSDIRQLRTPLDGMSQPGDAEFFLGGQLENTHKTQKRANPSPSYGTEPVAKTNISQPRQTAPSKPDQKPAPSAGGLSAQYGHTLQ